MSNYIYLNDEWMLLNSKYMISCNQYNDDDDDDNDIFTKMISSANPYAKELENDIDLLITS